MGRATRARARSRPRSPRLGARRRAPLLADHAAVDLRDAHAGELALAHGHDALLVDRVAAARRRPCPSRAGAPTRAPRDRPCRREPRCAALLRRLPTARTGCRTPCADLGFGQALGVQRRQRRSASPAAGCGLIFWPKSVPSVTRSTPTARIVATISATRAGRERADARHRAQLDPRAEVGELAALRGVELRAGEILGRVRDEHLARGARSRVTTA